MRARQVSGFLPKENRIVFSLYESENVIVPINSGNSLYEAAQEISKIGVDEYLKQHKSRRSRQAIFEEVD